MPDEKEVKEDAEVSKETKKSIESGKAVINLNKVFAEQDGKNAEKEEKYDQEKWRQEG